MEFFNPKEDVLHVEMTQYGKYLLSKGKFRPSHYLFFDEGVVYDANYGGISTEKQKQTHKRIKDETPKLKTQYGFVSTENRVNELIEEEQNTIENTFALVNPLGTSDNSSELYPKWNLQFLSKGNTKIGNSVEHMTSSYQTLRIPQIEMNVNYRTAVSAEGIQSVINEDSSLSSKVFQDKTYIGVEPRTILLQVLEENSVFEKENFDIEVYIKERQGNSRVSGSAGYIDQFIPLNFKKQISQVVDGILLDEQEEECIELDPSYVEYYFDIFTDNEIDENFICQSISELKSKNIYVDSNLDCPDLIEPVVANVYAQVVDDSCPDPDDSCK